MEASKLIIGGKTYDLNYLGKKKKTNLRRRLIVEYIQSKPAGEYITMRDFQKVAQMSTTPNTDAFVKRMIRDGVIQRFKGERPKTYYYAVLGAARVRTPATSMTPDAAPPVTAVDSTPDINSFVAEMTKLGVKFTITISNENKE